MTLIPQVALCASVMDAMLNSSRTGLGLVAVCDAQQQVQGVFTDGDLPSLALVGGGALPCTPVNGSDDDRRHHITGAKPLPSTPKDPDGRKGCHRW